MQDITFDTMWENIIIPMTNDIYKSMNDCDKKEISIQNLPQDKANLKSQYETTKDSLKQMYHYNNSDKIRKIDIHKVAACITAVIMDYQIFRFEIKENISDDVFLSNARLAYSIGLAIIKENLLFKYKDNPKILSYIMSNPLYVPETTEGHDCFSLGRIKTLMLNNIFLEEFDILAYSDMLFWIELFNIMIIEDKKAIEYVEKKEQEN